MKLLALTNMYPPHHYGGYELICRDVMTRLRERGHSVDVLTTTLRVPGAVDQHDDTVHRQLRFAWDDHVLQSPPIHQRWRDERHNHGVVRDLLREIAPDVVSVWNMGAMSLGLLDVLRRRDVPVVLNLCDDWLVYGPDLDPWARLFAHRSPLAGALASIISRLPCGVPDLANTTGLFISKFTRERALAHGAMKPGRAITTWSGIDERDFPVVPAAARPWSWKMIGVGRIDERKGIATAIGALAHLPPQATLTWLGRGDEAHRASLDGLAEQLGVSDRVHWAHAHRGDLPAAYRDHDVFVFPSTWAEPFGLVPIEAMACGLPVVGTGTGGSGEFLVDGVTALVPEPLGDPAAFATAIRRLAEDAVLRDRLVANGARVAGELTIGRLVDHVEAWHQAAADRFAHGEPAPRALDLP
ncbi:MAG: glycosyltransferase family 4 protein [Acidimicrobiales bacterium]|nr:glycosyltransferase family 4 protein [Acidimicrobiales bacterium]